MTPFCMALLQMTSVGHDQEANLRKGTEYCRRAAALGADLALFPEMWNIGYTCGFPEAGNNLQDSWRSQAIATEDSWVRHFSDLATELDLSLGLTYLQRWEPAPRNAFSLIDRRGEILFTYAKVHTCDFFPMESSCTPGDGFHVSTLNTRVGPVEVGAMICYDREHPESARLLMLKGAEIILTPNACTLEELRLGQFRARAFENSLAVAMTNYATGHPYCNGHSVAYDAQGSLLMEAGEVEGIYLATLDLDKLRQHRATTVWGNAFRRPHRYQALSNSKVSAPFTPRSNGFGQPWKREER